MSALPHCCPPRSRARCATAPQSEEPEARPEHLAGETAEQSANPEAERPPWRQPVPAFSRAAHLRAARAAAAPVALLLLAQCSPQRWLLPAEQEGAAPASQALVRLEVVAQQSSKTRPDVAQPPRVAAVVPAAQRQMRTERPPEQAAAARLRAAAPVLRLPKTARTTTAASPLTEAWPHGALVSAEGAPQQASAHVAPEPRAAASPAVMSALAGLLPARSHSVASLPMAPPVPRQSEPAVEP
jgi:hypothetical protein